MRSIRLLLLLLALTGTAGAQELVTTVVPVVGTTFGPGVIWRTDVEVVNDTGSEANVSIDMPMTAAGPRIITLGPGQTWRFPDVVGQAFGLDLALSPLVVTTDARRAMTVRATVYAVRGTEISKPQPIAVYQGQSYYPLRALDGLSFTHEYRTNIGLVNFGDGPADFLLALQRIPGRNLAVTRMTVAGGTLAHMSIQSVFPMITKGDDFTVVIETPVRDTYVYGSVIDNEHTGRFVPPRVTSR